MKSIGGVSRCRDKQSEKKTQIADTSPLYKKSINTRVASGLRCWSPVHVNDHNHMPLDEVTAAIITVLSPLVEALVLAVEVLVCVER